jgi:cobalt/nickel transport system ATP-binding protein
MLNLHNVTVVYPDHSAEARMGRGSPPDKTKAINDIDLIVNSGENIALIGENGAGKTTLLLAVVGILEKASGTIEVDGIRLEKKTANEIRKRTGLVFQNPDDQLFMPLIYDDVAFGCRNFGLPEDMVKIRVDETLKQLNISHLASRSSLRLSGGEKRLAAIATVLAMEPSVLMFDEPTAFLDPKARRSLVEALQKLHHTKIIATHDINFAAQVCDRIIILQNGKIAADGKTDLLYEKDLMLNCGLVSSTEPDHCKWSGEGSPLDAIEGEQPA